MASNQNVNKVVYAGTTLIDLTGDDVTAASVLSGKKFHLPSGAAATGAIATKTASNLSASGKTVTVPAGYYASQATKDVATGSATAPASISGSSATVSTGTNTLTLTKTVSVTPSVSAGYVSSGTAGNSSVSLTASVTTKAAATYYPSASDQSISASQYLNGAQTIKAVKATNLTAANIKSGVTVQIGDASDADRVMSVTGTYTGSSIEYDLNPIEVTMTSNKVIAPNGTIASGSGSGYLLSDKITVSEGETYRLTAKMNYGNYVYALYNTSNSIVGGVKAATGGTWTKLTNELITIPSGVTGLRFGSYNNIAYGLKKRLQG